MLATRLLTLFPFLGNLLLFSRLPEPDAPLRSLSFPLFPSLVKPHLANSQAIQQGLTLSWPLTLLLAGGLAGLLYWLWLRHNRLKTDLAAQTEALQREIEQRQKAEAALSENQTQYRTLIKNIPNIGVLLFDEDLRYLLAEGIALKQQGFLTEQVEGQTLGEVLSAQTAAQLAPLYRAALAGQDHTFEAPFDDRIYHIQFVPLPHTQPPQAMAVAQDITKRRQSEEAYRESAARFEKIVDNMPVLLSAVDEQGTILVWNKECERVTGYSAEEMIGDPEAARRLFPEPEQLPQILQEVDAREHEYRDWEIDLRTKGGEIRTVAWSNISRTCPIPGWWSWSVGVDVTARQWMETALRASEKRFRAVWEVAADAMALSDPEGIVVEANPAYLKLYGYPAEEIIDHSFAIIMPPEQREQAIEQYKAVFASPEILPAFESVIQRADGTERVVESRIQFITQNGQRTHMLSIIRDMTERKQTEEALIQARDQAEAASQAKNLFLAHMSHELRTPLNGILGYSQFLDQDQSLTTRQKETVQIIQRSGEHLLALINDLLDLSKIEAEKLEIASFSFDLPRLLQDLADLFQPQAYEKQLRFIYRWPPTLPQYVQGDVKRLRQVLINLLSNALKFTQKGQVTFEVKLLETEPPASQAQAAASVSLRFVVEDTGAGIEPEHLDSIFSPFKQINDSRQTTDGTGLGLAISKRLVTMMEGTIQVKSRPGTGSRFWVDLTLPVELGQPAQPASEPVLMRFSGPPKILVVDDYTTNRRLLEDMLNKRGFKIETAANGQLALDKLETFQPDLILMDLVMPVMDGLEATRRLRQLDSPLSATPVIAVSARTAPEDQQQSLAAGCNAFISKPVAFTDLMREIKMILGDKVDPQPDRSAELAAPTELAVDLGPALPQAQLAALLDLAERGHIKKLRQQLETLAADQPDSALVDRLQRLTRRYRIKQIIELLNIYLKKT